MAGELVLHLAEMPVNLISACLIAQQHISLFCLLFLSDPQLLEAIMSRLLA